ncbi:hypothetical protein [Streptomyces sp. NPDC096311]|uniref:hypothetical protein n=1 Tax=Streptomyces sp. NPDC096311 TaxID=3366083 RepID=UPI0037FD92CB
MDATLMRTTMSVTAPGAHHPTMSGTHVRTRCAAPDVPHRTGARTAGPPLVQVPAGAHRS